MPFSAGGTTDLFGRLLAQHMQKNFDKPFIVENSAGAGGNIGAGAVAKAAPDGYTFLVGTVSTHAINPFLYSKLPYDTVKDFQPVSLIARLPNILVVHPSLPVNNVQELIAHLKANPDKLSYGSSGAGTSIHLAAELFKIKTGTTMTHVPFRSSGDIMNNLTGGHINLAFDNITLAWPQVKAGRLRALAVSSTARSAVRARRADGRRHHSGFRGDVVAWRVRAGRNAEAHRRQDGRRDEAHPRTARREGEAGRDRRGRVADDAGGVRQVHRRRTHQVGRRREGVRREARLGPPPSCARRPSPAQSLRYSDIGLPHSSSANFCWTALAFRRACAQPLA